MLNNNFESPCIFRHILAEVIIVISCNGLYRVLSSDTAGNHEKLKRRLNVFWGVTPCGMGEVHGHFGGTYCLHFQGQ
jgi:hypothetical protein